MLPRLQGAFSTVVMTKDRVVAFRDPHGLRPLSIGALGSHGRVRRPTATAWPSESCAFDIIGAKLLRDVEPGEMVTLGEGGLQSRMVAPGGSARVLRVRVHLLRAPDSRMSDHGAAGRARADGRDPRGARRRSRPTS